MLPISCVFILTYNQTYDNYCTNKSVIQILVAETEEEMLLRAQIRPGC